MNTTSEFDPFINPFLADNATAAQKLARETLASEPFPSFKQEAWKYTNLAALKKLKFALESGSGEDLGELISPELRAQSSGVVIYANGSLLSTDVSACVGVSLRPITEAEHAELAGRQDEIFPAGRSNNVFSVLNGAIPYHGSIVVAEEGVTVEKPLIIIHVASDTKSVALSNRRHGIWLKKGSSLSVVELHLCSADKSSLVNSLTEVVAEESATLSMLKVQSDLPADNHADSYHIASTSIIAARASQVDFVSLLLGSKISRQDITVDVIGKGADVFVGGLSVGRSRQHHDHHVDVSHHVGESKSRQLFKSILTDYARGVFNGRVYIAPQAQKVDSDQLNKTLLLSKYAEIDTKPELEVYADDVKATHGAAIGRLNDDELFYLQSRGINKSQAAQMLAEGYMLELADQLRLANIKAWAQVYLSQWLQGHSINGEGLS